jgi:hypothetical protein
MKAAFGSDALPAAASADDVGGAAGAAPVRVFALLGSAWLVLIAWVLIRWFNAPYFGPTDPGPDPVPNDVLVCIRVFETLMSALGLFLLWEFIIKPWWKDGEPSADGILCAAWLTLWFQDLFMNWIVHVLSYNSHALNFGNWTAEVPGWVSPRSNLVPEPVLALALSYFGMATCGAWTATLTMAKVKMRWPRTSNTTLILVGLGTGMLLDWVYEHTLISFQLMSYMGVVPELTLGFGTIYQFPLYEAVFFGGVVGLTGVVWYFKDDKGFTLAERGVEKLQISRSKGLKTFVRFLSLVGLLQCALFFFYSLPMQLFSVNAAPFPENVPSYLRNGVCGPGTPYECATMQLRPRGRDEPLPQAVPSSAGKQAH